MQNVSMNEIKRMQAARLRRARARRFATATDAARHFRWTPSTYLAHENAHRGITRDIAGDYARAFGVSAAWLLTGEGDGRPGVPIVAYVGAGAQVWPIDDHAAGGGMDEVEAPPGAGEDAVALIVRGDSMRPAYYDGDVIIYERQSATPVHALGRECVVKLADGRVFIKVVHQGSRADAFTLSSHNADPMIDVLIEWAAPIAWVDKRRRART